MHQHQPLRGHQPSRMCPVPALQDVFYSICVLKSQTCFHQCSGQDPDHMIQKTVPGKSKLNPGAFLQNPDRFYGPHRGFLKPLQRTERPVIMGSAQIPGGCPHGVHIQRFLHPGQVPAPEYIGSL